MPVQTFVSHSRCFTLMASHPCLQKGSATEDAVENSSDISEENAVTKSEETTRPVVDVQTSIRYIQSKGLHLVYGFSSFSGGIISAINNM
jgi:hypothetical protein